MRRSWRGNELQPLGTHDSMLSIFNVVLTCNICNLHISEHRRDSQWGTKTASQGIPTNDSCREGARRRGVEFPCSSFLEFLANL